MEDRGIIHDKEKSRFTLDLGNGDEAYISYTTSDGVMNLVHSEVPFRLRGQGVGKELVEKTFEHIHTHGEKAVAICSYIRVIAERSEKWRNIIQ